MEFREDVLFGMDRPMSPPLMNGGGCCKTVEHVKELAGSIAGGILCGSFTKEERLGNPGDVWWVGNGAALNSLGMPNGGHVHLRTHLAEMVAIAHDAEKALIVNVAGFDPSEYAFLARLAFEYGADAVELNLGCPNVVKNDGSRKPIASFNLEAMEEIISRVEEWIHEEPVWVKVSPYSDPELLKGAAAVLTRHPAIKAVTAVNTFPCAYGLKENGRSAIDVGLAGLSGHALKHIGLGQIKQWRALLPPTISLIAAGGIATGQDMKDYSTVGADAFQMTTELLKTGTLNANPFEKVAAEYLDLELVR